MSDRSVDAEAVMFGGDQLDVLVDAEPELDEGILDKSQTHDGLATLRCLLSNGDIAPTNKSGPSP